MFIRETDASTGLRWISVALMLTGLAATGRTLGEGTKDIPTEDVGTPVGVFLSESGNLQWLNFWVAQGAGMFSDEGLDVELVFSNKPGGGSQYLVTGKADMALMSRPKYLNAIGKGQPVVIFANLFRNDPINLVVQGDVAEERDLSAELPLAERLERMRGLRVGVAPGPPPRLRVLLVSAGMDPDKHIETVIVPGPEQNRAFGDKRVDALYAHTPYLETALVDQDAVLVVNQSAGEVPGLGGRQIHALVCMQDYARKHPEVLVAMTRAIHRAQQLIHADLQATVRAVLESEIKLEAPEGLPTIVGLYAPAIPDTPAVSAGRAFRELALFPEHKVAPDLTLEDIAAHVDNQYVERALAGDR